MSTPGKAASKALEAGYYDAVYQKRADYAADWRKCIYLPMWKVLVSDLVESGRRNVLEIGCGTGQLAAMLAHEVPGLSYRGLDFSPTAVKMAKKMNPRLAFEVADVRSATTMEGDYDVVIATEVLEHIADDIGLLLSIRAGALVLFSVPNFDSAGHVRFFRKADDIRSRYKSVLHDIRLRWVSLRKAKKSAICVGSGIR